MKMPEGPSAAPSRCASRRADRLRSGANCELTITTGQVLGAGDAGGPGGVVRAEGFAIGEADEGGAAGGVHVELGFGEEVERLLEGGAVRGREEEPAHGGYRANSA